MSRILSILLLLLSFQNVSFAAPSIEDYGRLPTIRSMTISPDGKHYAMIRNTGGNDEFIVANLKTKKAVFIADVQEFHASSIGFATNTHVILHASDTDRVYGFNRKLNLSGSYVYDMSTEKIKLLLNKSKGLHPVQGGLGKIVGFNAKEGAAYMPAFEEGDDPHHNLYRVSLKTGRGVPIKQRGNSNTVDWFVSENGKPLAQEDYDNRKQLHQIYSFVTGKKKLIFEQNIPRPELVVQGISVDESSLLYLLEGNIYEMRLSDGVTKKTDIGLEGHELDTLILDWNRKLLAVRYSGVLPFDDLVDDDLEANFQRIESTFPNSKVSFIEATRDRRKLLAKISGNEGAGTYVLFDASINKLIEMGSQYPNISVEDIGQIKAISYKARDGLKIPAIVTWPTNTKTKTQRKNLPLLVFPHGGPEANDSIGFDWWAQYFANRGYLILQPNFRGSTGFGQEHLEAGYGKWGREMQDDVSDGVKALITAGYADPNRVCIMGASYGGYSALAGGAFSPELYRCVISVAGVSDLPRMLDDDKRKYGGNHWVARYWQEQIGDSKKEREKLDAISPINFASNFSAPILLVHGVDDTVVPLKQSIIMHKALESAGVQSDLVKLKGEDHWLSSGSTRLQMMKAIGEFLDKHNPV